jgi:hypothetical protein
MHENAAQIGYCTNVHAGADLETTRANLARHSLAVKARVSPDQPMGIGLWLSAVASRKLRAEHQTEAFADWLGAVGLLPFTLNGFPHGDFHQPVVKHRVYEPTWWEQSRLDYTLDLIAIQHILLPEGEEGSISTLPICWGQPEPGAEQLFQAAALLHKVAQRLEHLERERGRLIYLCLEPEPGCYLQHGADVVRFFEEFLLHGIDEALVRRHIRVCHDVCHAAVMFEKQDDVLKTYRSAGIAVGKVQVSSAVRVPWDEIPVDDRPAALAQLSAFAEDRYLHQTVSRSGAGDELTFYEDLPSVLKIVGDARPLSGEWRVHFHVPVYLERFGQLTTSQADIRACLEQCRGSTAMKHYEVETYAWDVLPAELKQPELASGIAHEVEWFRGILNP